jgi:mannan polymerase II complex MNN11 subunit
MHLAMPPRKTSRPPPYARNQQSPGVRIPQVLRNILRRDRLRIVAGGILAILGLLWVFGLIGGGGSRSGSAAAALIGTGPPVVIVTVFDPQAELGWVEKIKKNRDQYAKKHGRSSLSTPASLTD